MQWQKLGLIYAPTGANRLMRAYARIPIADHLEGDLYRVYFGSRDETNRERVFRILLDMASLRVIEVDERPVLDFGENLGAFDDNGITPCCVVNLPGRKLLYYCGWNIHVKIPFTCAIGLAESLDGGETFKKLFKGAVIDRDRQDFQFVAVNDVLLDNGLFRTWYLSCQKWEEESVGGKPRHYYNIHYAESPDGTDWKRFEQAAIDFDNPLEYAISTPRVVKDGPEDYKMWYSHRASPGAATYRIGYAESADGRAWTRKDALMKSFDVSQGGFDSDMVCYPYVFDHKGERYMLYNGNDYGRTGFGIARLEATSEQR